MRFVGDLSNVNGKECQEYVLFYLNVIEGSQIIILMAALSTFQFWFK